MVKKQLLLKLQSTTKPTAEVSYLYAQACTCVARVTRVTRLTWVSSVTRVT